MSIRFSKYINITSVVGGAAQVPQRQWCGRVFSTNPLVPPNAVLQFASAADVGAYFGTSSDAYNRALKYFQYASPVGYAPQALQFARWVQADQPAVVYGESAVSVLATLKAITAGKLSLQFGASVVNLTGISFSAATTLTDVATALQTAIRAGTGAPNGELTTATVTWDATNQRFNFVASSTGVVAEKFNVIVPASGVTTATDVAAALGWYASQGATIGDAQPLETAVAGFNRVIDLNNNFGSFCYSDTASGLMTLSDVTAIAQANAALNVMFMYRVLVTPSGTFSYTTVSAALIGIAGVGLEYEDTATSGARQFVEMMPMSVQAAINFDAVNGAVGFMYKQNGAYSPSVVSTVLSNALDAARVNYMGQTQSAGANITFYQRGVLCGGATAPLDSTVFANEMWLKDLAGSTLMNLQLSAGEIPANRRGQSMCDTVMQSVIDAGLNNGTISVNSSLTIVQQIFVTQQTNDATAWQQVQNAGYWFGSKITSAVVNGVTEYTYAYTLIYRKDDVIKTITGSHQLI
jgi:hypothetical protein